jgi:hypothetical protein
MIELNQHIETISDELPSIFQQYKIEMEEAFHIYHCICNDDISMMEWLLTNHIDKLQYMRNYHEEETSEIMMDSLIVQQELLVQAKEIIKN